MNLLVETVLARVVESHRASELSSVDQQIDDKLLTLVDEMDGEFDLPQFVTRVVEIVKLYNKLIDVESAIVNRAAELLRRTRPDDEKLFMSMLGERGISFIATSEPEPKAPLAVGALAEPNI